MFLESYERLNLKQRRVIDTDKSFAVHAGPGSGKTEVLALKAVRLLEQVVPLSQNVALVTYTNEMAREMLDRLCVLGNLSFDNLVIGTVHGFCLQQVIIPFASLLSDRVIPLNIAGEIESKHLWQAAGDQFGHAKKHRLAVLNRESPEWQNSPLLKVCLKYEGFLTEKGKLDFDGVALNAYWILRDHPFLRLAIQSKFPWLLIDEYQDLLYPFREMVYLFLHTDMEIIAVGDTNQAIYAQSDKDTIQILLAKAKEISSSRMLEESFDISYRCPQNLLEIAGSIIGGQKLTSETKVQVAEVTFESYWNSSAKAVETVRDIQKQSTDEDTVLIAHPENWQIDNTRRTLKIASPGSAYYFDIWSMIPSTSLNKLLKYNPLVEWLQDIAYWCTCPLERFPDQCTGWLLTADCQIRRWIWQSSGSMPYMQLEFALVNSGPSLLEIFETWQNMKSQYLPSSLDPLKRAYDRIEFFEHLMFLRTVTAKCCGEWLDECRARLDIEAIQSNFKDSEDYQQAISFLFDLRTGESQKIRNCRVEDFASHRSANKPKLSLLTVHASKGLTFDHVIVVGIQESNGKWTFPGRYSTETQQKRLVYTILTSVTVAQSEPTSFRAAQNSNFDKRI